MDKKMGTAPGAIVYKMSELFSEKNKRNPLVNWLLKRGEERCLHRWATSQLRLLLQPNIATCASSSSSINRRRQRRQSRRRWGFRRPAALGIPAAGGSGDSVGGRRWGFRRP